MDKIEIEKKLDILEEKDIVYLSASIGEEFIVWLSSKEFYWYYDMESNVYVLCFDNNSIDVKLTNIKEIDVELSEITIVY